MINNLFSKEKYDYSLIAREIIKNTGLDENLGIIKQKNHTHSATTVEMLTYVMALSTTNLVQTMRADFITHELSQDIQDRIVQEYMAESLRRQDVQKLSRRQIQDISDQVMRIVLELGKLWDDKEDPQGAGPGPRYYCVKEVLKRLGGAVNHELHDALFELMYLQYRHYYRYFQFLLVWNP